MLTKTQESREKSEIAQLNENKTLDNYAEQIDNAIVNNRELTSMNKDLLWSGNYSTSVNSNVKQTTGGCKLNNNYNIEDYSFILILAATYTDYDTVIPNYFSTIFPVDVIKQNYGYPTVEVATYASNSYSSRIDMGFINSNSFYIAWKSVNGWNQQYVSHIYGIK